MSPNYSVLISVYYKERPIYLKSALDSVLNQTLPPSEIILIEEVYSFLWHQYVSDSLS